MFGRIKAILYSIISVYFILFLTNITAQTITTDLKTLTKNSEVILVGKVKEQKSSWNEDKTRIYTDVTVEVEEYFKGAVSDKSIVVRHLGGEVGEVGELYTHIPTFKEEEEMVLFVKQDKKDGKYRVNDGENGKIEIMKDKDSDAKLTTSNKKVADLKKQIKSYMAE